MRSARVYPMTQRHKNAPYSRSKPGELERKRKSEQHKAAVHDAGQQRLRELRRVTVLPLDLMDNLNQKWPVALHESWHDYSFCGQPDFKNAFIAYLDNGLPDQLLISSPQELSRMGALVPLVPVSFVLSALKACWHNGDRGHDLYDILIWRVARERSLDDTSARTGHSRMAVDLLERQGIAYVVTWCACHQQVLEDEAAERALL